MRLSFAGALGLLAAAGAAAAAPDPAALVDPFIGTGGHGHTHPAATLPFGMVQLGPDTRLTGWDGCSGYHFTDDVVYGFSHTHLSGTGISDYGDVLFVPGTGAVRWDNGAGGSAGYSQRLDKSSERAEPGYYAVRLPDAGIEVELTATERTGFHRYVFPAGSPAHVLVDLAHRDRVLGSALRVTGPAEIEGFRRSTGWADDQIVFFVARFSRPFAETKLALGGEVQPGRTGIEGEDVKGAFAFGEDGGELVIRVGISAVDTDGARANLEAEAEGRGFDDVRRAARATWNDALERIAVEGGTDAQRAVFATALYHSLVAPNLFSDADGRYRGMDGEIHRTGDARRYTVFSLWDTFRATHPLFTLIEPERTRELVETFLGMYAEGGRLPVWELAANETDVMIGYHSVSVIADAWIKGIRGFDADAALEAMLASANRDQPGLNAYRRQGFLSADDESESVSKTLEYAYDDWCIAQVAEGLGRGDVAAELLRRAQAWRHLLDPDTGFFRARRNQQWVEPFDPARVDFNYTEANAWQYGFFVPHDVEGLIDALGGEERFLARLDSLFAADSSTTGRDQPDITGLLGQYAHGNEPSHHIAWLYHYAGRPDRSAARVREILERFYSPAPDGLVGNEDCGQMSSWYVLSAMGLYPVCPGSPDWLIGAPIFDRVTLRLADGRTFTIETEGESDCVAAAELNGEPLPRSYLRHEEIARGGTLRLTLAKEPGAWGTAPEDRPRSRGGGERVPAAPFVRGPAGPFRDSVTVTIASADPGAVILRAPADSAAEWRPARGPLTFRETTGIRMVAERDGVRSPVVEAAFHRIPNDWTVTLADPPAPQYDPGGPGVLVDGVRAGDDWRTGGWHGFQGRDFEATVDLGELRAVRRAGAGFLQDVRSWIWMPTAVEVSVSADGSSWRLLARIPPGVSDREMSPVRRDLVADLDGVEARFVRIRARTYGIIPSWHPGGGGAAWIFVDEILIE